MRRSITYPGGVLYQYITWRESCWGHMEILGRRVPWGTHAAGHQPASHPPSHPPTHPPGHPTNQEKKKTTISAGGRRNRERKNKIEEDYCCSNYVPCSDTKLHQLVYPVLCSHSVPHLWVGRNVVWGPWSEQESDQLDAVCVSPRDTPSPLTHPGGLFTRAVMKQVISVPCNCQLVLWFKGYRSHWLHHSVSTLYVLC